MKKVTNLNDYTLLEINETPKIYFYPTCDIFKTEISSKRDEICFVFEIENTKRPNVKVLYCNLYDCEGNNIHSAYGIDVCEIGENKYCFLNNELQPSLDNIANDNVIDFNTLNYKTLMEILKNREELNPMIPCFMDQLKNNIDSLRLEQKIVEKIDIPSPKNYFQNICGFVINNIENIVANPKEQEESKNILKNVRKKFDIVLHDEFENRLAFESLYALYLEQLRSKVFKSREILKPAFLKPDTNRTSIKQSELFKIMQNFVDNLTNDEYDTEEMDIVEERIKYIILERQRQKEVKNFLKIILIDDQYLDKEKRSRMATEEPLKELIIHSLAHSNFHILPRSQVLVYNPKDDDTIDFIAIISNDIIYEIFKTYKINSSKENAKKVEILKKIEYLLEEGKPKNTGDNLLISILLLLQSTVYYYKNINKNNLLINKEDYIFKLDYRKGTFDITIVNKLTDKRIGHLIKVDKNTTEELKKALDKNEKAFNSLLNKILYKNLIACLDNLSIDINIKHLTHKDIIIKINNSLPKDIFNLDMRLDAFLLILTNVKITKEHNKITKENKAKEPTKIKENTSAKNLSKPTKYGLPKEEYEYIIRKSNSISIVVSETNSENKKYIKIATLYKKFKETGKDKEKEEIILKLKELLNN